MKLLVARFLILIMFLEFLAIGVYSKAFTQHMDSFIVSSYPLHMFGLGVIILILFIMGTNEIEREDVKKEKELIEEYGPADKIITIKNQSDSTHKVIKIRSFKHDKQTKYAKSRIPTMWYIDENCKETIIENPHDITVYDLERRKVMYKM